MGVFMEQKTDIVRTSRVGKKPILLPTGVVVDINGCSISIRGKLGTATIVIHPWVNIRLDNNTIYVTQHSMVNDSKHRAMTGTTRALLNNLVNGVTHGFERKLQLVGVGYKAQLEGNKIILNLGFSHLVEFIIPEGITVNIPTQTELIIKGIDKQQVGVVAAKIRSYRPPEPYKGKGIRYADEIILLKETKKK